MESKSLNRIDPENVRKIKHHVNWLLFGLDQLPEGEINLSEQAIGLRQLADELDEIAVTRCDQFAA